MAIREGAWDCLHCGRKLNRGPEKFCGGCGAPRGPEVKFYLPEDAAEVTDAEALSQAQAGADWVCSYCEADNPVRNDFCSGCGASKEGTQARPVVEHRFDAPAAPPPPPPPAPSKTRSGWKKGCGLGCLGLVALFIFFAILGTPREKDLTVTGHQWVRTIAVEEQRTVTEQAWEGEVPSAANLQGSTSEVHHVDRIQTGTRTKTRTVSEQVRTGSERVKVGTRDLGNGYFEDVYEDRPVYETREREETYQEPVYVEKPVYRKRYRYQIEKWLPDREARDEGRGISPSWPDPQLAGKQREASRQEVYEVYFTDPKGKQARYRAPNEQVWRSFEEGRTYKGKVKSDGEVVEIKGGG